MKRYLFVAGILFVITSLIACGSTPDRIVRDIEPEAAPKHIVQDIEPEAAPEPIVRDIESEAASEHITGEIEPETTPNHIAEDSEPEKGAEDSAQHSIFGKVLWDVYRTGMLPEGNPLDGYDMESVQENSYAIFDADGDGIVYFLLPADWDGYYNNVPMVDGADYESWRSSYLNGAAELKVPLQKLTEENISELEPVG